MPHADQVRWLPEACSEAPMQANLGAELGRGGDRLRAGSCIFLLDFEAFFFEVGRTIFGIAFNVGVFVTVAGARRRSATSSVERRPNTIIETKSVS